MNSAGTWSSLKPHLLAGQHSGHLRCCHWPLHLVLPLHLHQCCHHCQLWEAPSLQNNHKQCDTTAKVLAFSLWRCDSLPSRTCSIPSYVYVRRQWLALLSVTAVLDIVLYTVTVTGEIRLMTSCILAPTCLPTSAVTVCIATMVCCRGSCSRSSCTTPCGTSCATACSGHCAGDENMLGSRVQPFSVLPASSIITQHHQRYARSPTAVTEPHLHEPSATA